MASQYNPQVPQGIDWQFTSIAYSVAADGTKTVIDLTGFSIALQIHDLATNVSLLSLAVGSGITVPTPSNGTVLFRATAAQLAGVAPGNYSFNVVATAGGAGSVKTLWISAPIMIVKAPIV